MDHDNAQQFVRELFNHLLKRSPGEGELSQWTARAIGGTSPEALFRAFIRSREYARRQGVSSLFAPGHFHSPVVDPATIGGYYANSRAGTASDLIAIKLELDPMLAFWDDNINLIRSTPFREERSPEYRFFYNGSPYPWGDAITLRAMIAVHRPRQIVEIGSGFSTACMLDSADQCGNDTMMITCIEPYPDRLRSMLRPGDDRRVNLVETGVQDVAPERFDILGAGDILFIDSTHVLKTGSDVHHEMFNILPRLKLGVLVHIHDCPFPFEYPEKWVYELNYSWNEAYALRAFLMYNDRFSIIFWNSYLARMCRPKLQHDCPEFLRNPGSSIWLRVQH